jgi:predicted metal-dependent hydrolase
VRLFNRRRFLDAHETWEAAWREAEGADRGFLEGLVQLAAGLHLRTKRGGTRGAVHLLSQSLVLLEDYRPATHAVDVESLVSEVGAYVDWIRALDRPHRLLDRGRLPRIR